MLRARFFNYLLLLLLLAGCGNGEDEGQELEIDSSITADIDDEVRMPFQTEPIDARDLDELLKDVPNTWYRLNPMGEEYQRIISCDGYETVIDISPAMGAVLRYSSTDTVIYRVIDCSYASSEETGEDERHHYAFTLGGDDNEEIQSELVFIPNGMSYWTGLTSDVTAKYCSYVDSAKYARIKEPCP